MLLYIEVGIHLAFIACVLQSPFLQTYSGQSSQFADMQTIKAKFNVIGADVVRIVQSAS